MGQWGNVMPSAFAKKLASVAEGQYDAYHFFSESDPQLAKQIEKYWRNLNFAFPGVATPWSAVFVSWCVWRAGATKSEFLFNAQHSQFVNKFIKNGQQSAGVFRAFSIDDYGPQIGDIIQNNRGHNYTFAYAASHTSYPSHTAIVVETGIDSQGAYALTIGGNESDSVRRKIVRLRSNGRIKQRTLNPYICVVQNLN
jgi:hypothetical protein